MKTNYILVDYENVKVAHVEGLSEEWFRIIIFLGIHDTKLPLDLVLAMQKLQYRGSYVVLDAAGRNALDFHLVYYLGTLVAKDPSGYFHIVSKDLGFDPLIRHLKAQGILCARSPAIDELPCFVKSEPGLKAVNGEASVLLPAQPKSTVTLDDLVWIAADDLIKRKASRPRKDKTLRSTLHATCGKQLPASQIEKVLQELLMRGWVKISGTSVSYNLPQEIIPPLPEPTVRIRQGC